MLKLGPLLVGVRYCINLFYMMLSQLDILEYIHEHEYVHGDIKASNLLLSYKNPDQVTLQL